MPYQNLNEKRPYRASLHNHTFKKRPTASPVAALSLYRQCGIPVVALTDHDRRMPEDRKAPGPGQVPWLEEDFEHSYTDAVLLRGVEATYPDNHIGILGFWPDEIPFKPGEEGYIPFVNEQGGFTIINHPAAWNERPEHVLENTELSSCQGIEIFNGGQAAKGERTLATPLWDACLTAGLRLWALANSDCHMYDFSLSSNPTHGYNVLFLEEMSVAAVLRALREGEFYASSGLEAELIQESDQGIKLVVPGADHIRFFGARGELLHEVAGESGEYEFRGNEPYVRAEAHAKRPAQPGSLMDARLWLQPMFFTRSGG